jgi:phosphopantetheinyl transferase (holo-ACP synthase)
MAETDLNPVQNRPVFPCARDAREVCGGSLCGVGVDAEPVWRFEKLASDERFRHRICSPREAEHLASQERPALAFCASFCCKEALCKALGEAYAFPECECFHRPGASELELVLSPSLRERHGLAGARAGFHERFLGERGECVVEVHLFRGQARRDDAARTPAPDGSATAGLVRSRLETLAVAEVEADRRQIEERFFSPPEIADLGSRRVQSLAGLLTLKRALAALGVEAGCAATTAPGDFELSHHASGAPRLVAVPEGIALGDVFVSISHTRQWAYGLAAIGGRGPAGCSSSQIPLGPMCQRRI